MKNPYAYINEKLVTVDSAQRGEDFRCPNCKEILILKRGEIKAAHFAHKPDMTECSKDLIMHQIAMDLLCRDDISFQWEYQCQMSYEYSNDKGCVFYGCNSPRKRKRLGGYKMTQQEYPLGKYRVDIAILRDSGGLHGGIEVYNTHKTKKGKWKYFNDNKIPCVEVEAQSIIDAYYANTPQFIKCLRNNLHLFIDCKGCDRARKRAQEQYLKICLPWLPKQDFIKAMRKIRKLPLLTDEELRKEESKWKNYYPERWKGKYYIYRDDNGKIITGQYD